jgi:methylenetetrahydrofolate reductase (NADPH)
MVTNEASGNKTDDVVLSGSPLSHAMAQLLENCSIEMPARAAAHLPAASRELRAGTRIYVPSLTGQSISATSYALNAIHRHGFEAVPHIAARRIRTRTELSDFIAEAVAEYGVRRVMLIAGDLSPPTGAYYDSLAILEDGVLGGSGLTEVGLAGYPEGHPAINHKRLAEMMVRKVAAARAQGLVPSIVTQFCFAPRRIVEYCSELARIDREITIHAGIVGPTDPVALFRYARLCGVNASRQALGKLGAGIAKLAIQTDPGKQIQELARYTSARTACRVGAIHMYGFGGLVRTARWLRDTAATARH